MPGSVASGTPCITEKNIVYFASRTEYLNIIPIKKLEFDPGAAHMKLMSHKVLLRLVSLLVLLFSLSLLFYKFSMTHLHLQVFYTRSTHGRSLDTFPKINSLSKILKDLIEKHIHLVCSIDSPTTRRNVQNHKMLDTNSKSSDRNLAGYSFNHQL